MKTTAVLLYPVFSNYELSVALSALGQVEKPVAFFGPSHEVIRSEEGLPVHCDALIDEVIDPGKYDSLLLTGCMDPMHSFMLDERYYRFVRQFDHPDMVIGAISSAPILLSMTGILDGHSFDCGVPTEIFAEVRMDPSRHVKGQPYVEDGNLLTAHGANFVAFGVRFAQKLGLEISPAWYGRQ